MQTLTSTGTLGQFIPGVTPNEAAGNGEGSLQLLQLEQSDRYRTNIGLAETTGPAEYRCHVVGQYDARGRNRQTTWYSFRVDQAKGRLRNAVGGITGDTSEQIKGKAEELKGKAQRKIGEKQVDVDNDV